MTTDYQDTPMR